MKPLTNRVIIEVEPPQEQTKSGLYIKQEWKSVPPEGIVKAIGPDVKNVKPGDKVLFERYASVILENNLRVCLDTHIHAIIDEKSDD